MFDDGTRAVYEEYVSAEAAADKLLDAYVGRAAGARGPLVHPLGARQAYTDHMPGEPASARHRDLTEAAELASTRDGVFVGLHHALTATHGVTADRLVLGEHDSLITVDDGSLSHGALPEPGNPFVSTFFRQARPQVFSWTDHPIPPGDIETVGRHLESLRPLFEHLGRTHLHDTVMERLEQVAQHATGTDSLLTRPPGARVTPPVPGAETDPVRLPRRWGRRNGSSTSASARRC